MILILTSSHDPHADRVQLALRARGAAFIRFNPADFPSRTEASLLFSSSGPSGHVLRAGRQEVDLRAVTALWYRRPQNPRVHRQIRDQAVRDFVEQECATFLQGALIYLDGLAVPGSRDAIRRAQLKASQLRVAAAIGFQLPPTLFTNSPTDFMEFYRQHNGHIVTKQIGSTSIPTRDEAFVRYTEVVSKRSVGYARAVRFCPIIAQAYVPKQLELRITVVGRQVLAAEIHSQESNHTRHDWRRYDDFATKYLQHDLPRDVAARCLRLVDALGLCYGAIDMVLTPDGCYVFLEINPNGQYLWIEEATGLPISEALAELLVSGADIESQRGAA